MLSSIKRRAGVVLTAGALAASTLLVAPAPHAQAADAAATTPAATWLSGELGDNGLLGGDVTNTIDFALGLIDNGEPTSSPLIAQIKAGVDGALADYVAGGGSAPANAALFYDAIGAGVSADLKAKVEATVDDLSGKNEAGYSYAQAAAALALYRLGSAEAPKAVDFLVNGTDSHCPDGGWGVPWSGAPCTSETDATGRVVEVLAEIDPVAYGAAIQAGVDWLMSMRRADGSYGWPGSPSNVPHTSWAARGLAAAGATAAAATSASWVRQFQIVGSPCDGKLSAEAGAVAPDALGISDGTEVGLPPYAPYNPRWSWHLATAQSLVALSYAPPATSSIAVSVATKFVKASSTVTVRTAGLAQGANGCVSLAGKNVAVQGGTTIAASIALPAGSKTYPITLKTLAGVKTASVIALAPRTLPISKRLARVRVGKFQTVRVTGLKYGENVTLRYRGRVIARGKANVNGAFRKTFKVGRVIGLKRVTVQGQFGTRRGATTFRVVR